MTTGNSKKNRVDWLKRLAPKRSWFSWLKYLMPQKRWFGWLKYLNRGRNFNLGLAYVVVAALTISIPVLSHPLADDQTTSGIFHWRFFHWCIFHIDNYHFPVCFHENYLSFVEDEIWELGAIVQAIIFSVILIFEPEEKTGFRKIALILFLIGIFGLFAILSLGFHQIEAYQIMVLSILVSFSIADIVMFKVTKLKTYKMALWYVDVPILLALCLLTFHAGFPIKEDHRRFYSGAIAFQLLFGNILLFLIRLNTKLIKEDGKVT